jgi:membrane protein implicated in regulation of membrane protease activity
MLSTELLLRYETWMILAFVLIAADMLLGLEFFALAFGVGALLTGITLLAKIAIPLGISDSWQGTLTYFSVLSVGVLIPLRLWLNKSKAKGGKDINDY